MSKHHRRVDCKWDYGLYGSQGCTLFYDFNKMVEYSEESKRYCEIRWNNNKDYMEYLEDGVWGGWLEWEYSHKINRAYKQWTIDNAIKEEILSI